MAQAAVLAWDIDAVIDAAIASQTLIPVWTYTEEVVELIHARGAVLARVWRAFIRLYTTVDAFPANFANTSILVELAEAGGVVLARIGQAFVGDSLAGHAWLCMYENKFVCGGVKERAICGGALWVKRKASP